VSRPIHKNDILDEWLEVFVNGEKQYDVIFYMIYFFTKKFLDPNRIPAKTLFLSRTIK
jgi:hypothetical protein